MDPEDLEILDTTLSLWSLILELTIIMLHSKQATCLEFFSLILHSF